jgi:hypothetical protein
MKVRFIMLQKYISRWQLHKGSFILSHTLSHRSMCRIACPLFLVLILCQLDDETAGTFTFFLKLHTPHDELRVVLLCICIDCACIIHRLMLMGCCASVQLNSFQGIMHPQHTCKCSVVCLHVFEHGQTHTQQASALACVCVCLSMDKRTGN